MISQDTQNGISAYVYLYAPDGSYSRLIETEDDGTFRTPGLQSGHYYFAAKGTNLLVDGCAFYGAIPCMCPLYYCDVGDVAAPDAQAILVGTDNVSGIVIALPFIDRLFASNFEP